MENSTIINISIKAGKIGMMSFGYKNWRTLRDDKNIKYQS